MASADPRSPDFDPRLLNSAPTSDVVAPPVEPKKKSIIENLLESAGNQLKKGVPLNEMTSSMIGIGKAPELSKEQVVQRGKEFLPQAIPFMLPGMGNIGTGAVMAGSKGLEDVFEGKSAPETLKDMAISGGTGFATSGALGLVGKGLTKGAEFFVKKDLEKKLSEGLAEKVLDNPQLTAPVKEKASEIASYAMKYLKELKKDFGKQVGEAKKLAKQTGAEIDLSPVVIGSAKKAEKGGLLTKMSDPSYVVKDAKMKLLNKVQDEIPITPVGVDEAHKRLDTIDNLLTKVYQKLGSGKKITKAEQLAYETRGAYNEVLKNQMSGLIKSDANKNYYDFMTLAKETGLDDALRAGNFDKVQKTLTKAMKEGNFQLAEKLKKMDDMLPAEQKFFDKYLNKSARGETMSGTGLPENAQTAKTWLLKAPVPLAAAGLRNKDKFAKGGDIAAKGITQILGGN